MSGAGRGLAAAHRRGRQVARLLAVSLDMAGAEMSVEPVQINGCPALIVRFDGEIDGVVAVRIDDGFVTGLYVVRNPEKLSRVERETAVSRWTRGSIADATLPPHSVDSSLHVVRPPGSHERLAPQRRARGRSWPKGSL